MPTPDTLAPHPDSSSPGRQARLARLEALRRQIEAGTYRVDADALADALIRRLEQKPHRRVA